MSTLEVQGVKLKSEPAYDGTCEGCVGYMGSMRCNDLPNCCVDDDGNVIDIIWLEAA